MLIYVISLHSPVHMMIAKIVSFLVEVIYKKAGLWLHQTL